jgi:hypothetical protein
MGLKAMKKFWIGVIALVAGVAGFSASAQADDWRIARSSGEVWVSGGGTTPILVSTGSTVPERSTVATGPTGRAMLVRGRESVVVGPSTILTVAQSGAFTTMIQRAGSAEFEVERQNVQHFAVETPLLAALVKGTHFVVTASGQQAEVEVSRGIVEVTALASGQMGDFTAGMHAIVTADQGILGFIGDAVPAMWQGQPRAPVGLPDLPAGGSGGVQTALATTGDLVGDLASSILGTTGGLVGDVGDTVGELVGDVGDTVGDVVGSVGDVVGDVGDTVGDVVGDVGDVVGDLGDTVGDLGDTVGDTVGDLGDTVGDVGDTVGGVVEDLGDTVGDLGDTLGGLLGS